MKRLLTTIGGILFYIFIAAVVGWTASLTLAEVKQILPNDPITPYFALALLDGGALVWLLVFIGNARGMMQRATALLMLVLDLAGVVILSAGRILTGGQDMAAVSGDLGAAMVYSLIGATILNLIAGYIFHIANPEVLQQIELQTLDDMIQAEALNQARANIESEVQQLAAVLAARSTARLKYQLRLPMSESETGEIEVIEAKKKKTPAPSWLDAIRDKLKPAPQPVTTTYEANTKTVEEAEQATPRPPLFVTKKKPNRKPKFTGKRRPKIRRVCACGCGKKFTTTHPRKIYKNKAHKQRKYDRTYRKK